MLNLYNNILPPLLTFYFDVVAFLDVEFEEILGAVMTTRVLVKSDAGQPRTLPEAALVPTSLPKRATVGSCFKGRRSAKAHESSPITEGDQQHLGITSIFVSLFLQSIRA